MNGVWHCTVDYWNLYQVFLCIIDAFSNRFRHLTRFSQTMAPNSSHPEAFFTNISGGLIYLAEGWGRGFRRSDDLRALLRRVP